MARRNYYTSKKKNSRKSKYTDLEKMAYKMGQINRGLKQDSLLRDSYTNGLNSGNKAKPAKKTLFGDEK